MTAAKLILLSAVDPAALKHRAEGIATFLEAQPEAQADVAYTLAVGRKRFAHRAAVVVPEGRASGEVVRALERETTERTQNGASDSPRIAFMFPGQGSQFIGMGQELFERHAAFREAFLRCDQLLSPRLGVSLEQLLFKSDDRERDAETLRQTRIAQPALFVIEYCLARVLMDVGIVPDALIGHSIGEFAAACIANVFELEAALELVAERGSLMQSQQPGAMMAVRTSPDALAHLLTDEVTLAAHNAPELCVVSGAFEPMARFADAARGAGLEVRELVTSHAFHSPMMDPILEPFRRAVERAQPKPPTLPIISTLTGAPLTDEEATSPDYWARQLRHAVKFSGAVRLLFDAPNRVLLEVGPGTALTTSAAKQNDVTRPRALLESLGGPKDPRAAWDATLRCIGRLWLHGASPDWEALYDGPSRRLLRMPTYPFSRQLYWVEPPMATETGTPHELRFAGGANATAATSSDQGTDKALYALLASRLGRPIEGDDTERSFVELGFDSLALSQLRVRLQERFGVDVSVRQLFEGQDTPRLLAEFLEARVAQPSDAGAAADSGSSATKAVAEAKAAVAGPLSQRAPASAAAPSVATGPVRGTTTEPQRELWVACVAGPPEATLCYNECRRVELVGDLDEQLLQAAIEELVKRHEALRQVFVADGSEFIILPFTGFPLRTTDLSGLSADERAAQLARFERYEVETPFDLEKGPLFRAHLVRCEAGRSVLLLCAHHIAADGSSIFLLLRELSEIYSAYKEQRPFDLPAPDSYLTYAAREVARAGSPAGEADERFWLEHLSGHTDDLDLPTDRQRPAVRSFPAARQDFYLDAATTEALRGLGRSGKTTLQTVLMAMVQLLLQRVTRQTDIVLGMPASGQAAVGARALMGHCVHVLPIRQFVDPTKPFVEHLGDVRKTMLDCLEHQEVTFSSYLEKLQRPRDASRIPLVPFGFGMGRTPKRLPFADLESNVGTVHRLFETFEIYLFATEDGEGVNLAWSYNTDLFDAETIQLWQRCLETIAQRLTQDRNVRLDALDILHEQDRQRLLQLAFGPQTPSDEYVPPHERILRQGQLHPERTAVIASDVTLTFADLNRRANQLGQWLAKKGFEPGSLVAVCLERTSYLVSSLLGVWRAGLAYVPLDPKYPKARVQMILEDSAAPVVLTSRELVDEVVGREHENVRIVLLEDVLDELEREPDEVPNVRREPGHRAYVIFTSGSTGRPKGVQISQRAFDNFLVSMAKEPGFSADERILALTTISFDIAGLELFLPLTQGGSLVLVTADQAVDPQALASLAEEHQITALQATPATWQMLLDGGWQGDPKLKVLCGGEAFPQKLAERLLACCGEIWNVYGPTETTVWSSVKKVEGATDLTIGRPIDNTTMYILDDNMQLAPMGSGGELWIGGRGVAEGYLGRPDLTSERFKPNPFVAGDVIYRTGDLGRVRRDGEFECLGRVDFQVKIRGFRIELGEIETALVNQPAVLSAVVVAREDEPGNKVLVAYAVPRPGETIDTAGLKQQITAVLPGYMVPSAFVVIPELPMTPNNKVDRKALPPPAAGGDAQYQAPTLAPKTSVGEMLWGQTWSGAAPNAEQLPPCNWLVLADEDDLGRDVVALLRKAGHTVTRVHARDRYHESDEASFTVNPEVGREHFELLLARLQELGRLPDRVLHLWLAGEEAHVRGGSSQYHHHQERGLFALLHLSALLAKAAPERAITFHVVTTALHDPSVPVDARAKAAALGLARVIPGECVRQKVAVFELAASGRRGQGRAASAIAAEVLRGPTEPLVSARAGQRSQLHWVAQSAPARPASPPGGVALVFGLSPLGLALARRLSEAERAHVVYLTERTEAGTEGQAALEAALLELERSGKVEVRRELDLASHAALQQQLSEIQKARGAIRAVALALAEGAPLLLDAATEAELETRQAALLQLLLALDQLPHEKLERLFITTPLFSAVGGPGSVADAAAASLVELEAYRRARSAVVVHVGSARTDAAPPRAPGAVARDQLYFQEHGLDAQQVTEAANLIVGLAPGVYCLSPFELEEYRGRIASSAARDAAQRLGRKFVEPKNEIERRLAALWAQTLRLDRVSTEDSFFDLGGHSLLAVRLFAAINKEFGVALPLAALFEAPNVAALAKRLGGRAEAEEAPTTGESRLLIKLNRGNGKRSPLFVVHGAFGNVLNLRHLARLADPTRDFYGIQAQGLDGALPPHQSLVDAARTYVEEVRRVRPHGPYLVGGFCVGGVVALEMARLLKEADEEVEPVVLLDSHLPEKRGTLSMADRFQIQTERLRAERLDYVWRWMKGKYSYESKRLKKSLGLIEDESDPTQYRSQLVRDAIDHGMRTYEPHYYDGDAVLFRPPLAPHHHLSGGRRINVRRFFLLEDNGWSRVVRKLEIVELAAPPGDHDGFVLEPHVRDLARRIKPYLTAEDEPAS